MEDDAPKWGVGNQRDAQPFDHATVENERVELIFGQHAHSRRDDNCYARWPDGTIEAFDGHRCLVDVEIKSTNYLKTSGLSGNEVRKSVTATIRFDGFAVYQMGGRDPVDLMYRVAQTVPRLLDHPATIWRSADRDQLVGRPCYYGNEPAVVDLVFWDQGCCVLRPDGAAAFKTPPWHDPDDLVNADYTNVKIDFLDPAVYWFRNRESGPTP
jgi:hypothetical protein